MKIATFNINGVRAALGHGLGIWLEKASPDILCLQETKATAEQFESAFFAQLGYRSFLFPAEKKGYSGVAVLSKTVPEAVRYGSDSGLFDGEGRILSLTFAEFILVNAYFPSGSSGSERQEMKMLFLAHFTDFVLSLKKEGKPIILCGDVNICHRPEDIHNPMANRNSPGFLPEERQWLTEFLESGFVDTWRHFHPAEKAYSWWTYRFNARAKNLGWRIDYIFADDRLREKLQRCVILPEARFSDHAPVLLEIDIN